MSSTNKRPYDRAQPGCAGRRMQSEETPEPPFDLSCRALRNTCDLGMLFQRPPPLSILVPSVTTQQLEGTPPAVSAPVTPVSDLLMSPPSVAVTPSCSFDAAVPCSSSTSPATFMSTCGEHEDVARSPVLARRRVCSTLVGKENLLNRPSSACCSLPGALCGMGKPGMQLASATMSQSCRDIPPVPLDLLSTPTLPPSTIVTPALPAWPHPSPSVTPQPCMLSTSSPETATTAPTTTTSLVRSQSCLLPAVPLMLPPNNLAARKELQNQPRQTEGCLLPTVVGTQEGMAGVSCETVAGLLQGKFGSHFDHVVIVDCRYPYEFAAGHITDAINITAPNVSGQLIERFFNGQAAERTAVVMHCEYSQKRGPFTIRLFKEIDSRRNVWPKRTYPQVYLLEGGYKDFYNGFPHMCSPRKYLEQHDLAFVTECAQYDKLLDREKQPHKKSRAGITRSNSYGLNRSCGGSSTPITSTNKMLLEKTHSDIGTLGHFSPVIRALNQAAVEPGSPIFALNPPTVTVRDAVGPATPLRSQLTQVIAAGEDDVQSPSPLKPMRPLYFGGFN